MNPNYSHHSCELQITLVKDFQMLDLSFTQIPSRGYLIDRIEWDPTITKSKQYNTSNWDERFIRKIFPFLHRPNPSELQTDGSKTSLATLQSSELA